jgi:hypothetical protein
MTKVYPRQEEYAYLEKFAIILFQFRTYQEQHLYYDYILILFYKFPMPRLTLAHLRNPS